MCECCAKKILRLFFHAFNFVLFLCGLTLFSLGIWLAVDDQGVTTVDDLQIPGVQDAGQVWSAAVYIMLSVGVIIFFMGLLGCCGEKRARRHEGTFCLCLYELLICAALATELTFAILAVVYQSQINSSVQISMRNMVRQKYTSQNSTSGFGTSVSWNVMQVDWACCGSFDYGDYENSNFSITTGKPVPYECCTMTPGSKGISWSNVEKYTQCMSEAENYPLYTSITEPTYLITRGCYSVLRDWIKVHSDVIIGVGFGFAGLQVFTLVFAHCQRRHYKEERNYH